MPNYPKPAYLKALAGNPGKRKLPETAVNPAPIAPKIPDYLSKEARREWKRILPELEALGLLSKIDLACLAAYCAAYGRWAEAEKHLKKHGPITISPNGYEQKSAWLTIADKALDQLRKYIVELGLSPASRGRVAANPMEADGDDFFAVRR